MQFEERVAIKEATGSIEQMIKIKELCGDRIAILSGEDVVIKVNVKYNDAFMTGPSEKIAEGNYMIKR